LRKASQNEEEAKHMVSLAQLQEVPYKSMILIVGPPGSGKSYFCEQTVLQSLAIDKPVIYVTTEYDPYRVEESLKEKGLARIEPNLLSFVDAYSETVGLALSDRLDTVNADCANLSSIGIAISKLQERIGKKSVLLVFDSLTSPYLLSGPEAVRFMRLTLSRFAGEGNSVLACFDEGSGKEEDLVAMMSFSSGVIKMETADGRRVLNVVKHPKVEPTRIEVPRAKVLELWDMSMWRKDLMEMSLQMMKGGAGAQIRIGIVDYVNLFWPNFTHWSCTLWDPKRFPEMTYEMSKMHGEGMKELMEVFPWHQRILLKRLLPKSLSKVKDMKKFSKVFQKMWEPQRSGIVEYVEDISKTDEHYIRVSESFECSGFENIGAAMASIHPPAFVGACKGIEGWRGLERDWNAVEVKCIGLGDPYCEFKVVPGEIDELKDSLGAIDSTVLGRIHDRLINSLMGFLLDGKPLAERPKLGRDTGINAVFHLMLHPALASERFRIVMRMAGAKAGKEVGEHLMEAGVTEDKAVNRVLNFLEYCKVGKVTADETVRMKENWESMFYKFMTKKREEPCCYFTTGFLNGFFYAVKNQHVKETKCIAMGDPYCEWELR
jgi:predicted hydrocarbon binding protein/KaiC/GvpD/RAD55 family RecA-like ATPase